MKRYLQSEAPRFDSERVIAMIHDEGTRAMPAALVVEGQDIRDLDRRFMERAVEEARKSRTEAGHVPLRVGAVVVKDGKELGVAYRGEIVKAITRNLRRSKRNWQMSNLPARRSIRRWSHALHATIPRCRVQSD